MIKDYLARMFELANDMLVSAQEDAEMELPDVSEDTKFSIEHYSKELTTISNIIRALFPKFIIEGMENFTGISTQEEIEELLLSEIELFGSHDEEYDDYEDDEEEDDEESKSYKHYTTEEVRNICSEILTKFNSDYSNQEYLEAKLKAHLYRQVEFLPEIDSLETEIVKLLSTTGTDEVGFTKEENDRLRAIYIAKDAENHDLEVYDDTDFAVYTYLERGCVVIDNTIDCDMAYFSTEFKQELLNILKSK